MRAARLDRAAQEGLNRLRRTPSKRPRPACWLPPVIRRSSAARPSGSRPARPDRRNGCASDPLARRRFARCRRSDRARGQHAGCRRLSAGHRLRAVRIAASVRRFRADRVPRSAGGFTRPIVRAPSMGIVARYLAIPYPCQFPMWENPYPYQFPMWEKGARVSAGLYRLRADPLARRRSKRPRPARPDRRLSAGHRLRVLILLPAAGRSCQRGQRVKTPREMPLPVRMFPRSFPCSHG